MFFRFFQHLIYTNVPVALAASTLTLRWALYFKLSNIQVYVLLSFFTVLAAYNLQRYASLKRFPQWQQFPRWKNIFFYRNALLYTGIFSAIFSGFLTFFFLSVNQLLCIGFCLLFSLGYLYVPGILHKGLRSLPLIKTLCVAFCWAVVLTLLPAFDGSSIVASNWQWPFVSTALLVFAITLPFDIRDIELDSFAGIKTLPMLLGEKNIRMWSMLFLFLVFIIDVYFFSGNTMYLSLLFYLPPILLAAGLLLSVKRFHPEFYYACILESVLFFYGLAASIYLNNYYI